MTVVRSNVIQLRPRRLDETGHVLDAFLGHLERRQQLAANTRAAYGRQAHLYVNWQIEHVGLAPEAFQDVIGAEAAVTNWKRDLLAKGAAPASINQGLAAVTMLYQVVLDFAINVTRVNLPRPGEPSALTESQEEALRDAADRSSVRNAAIIFMLLETGARKAEITRLVLSDISLTPRTGKVRLVGKGDQVRVNEIGSEAKIRLRNWLAVRADKVGPDVQELWIGQQGPLRPGHAGVSHVVETVGLAAGIPGLGPHTLRHTYATRLRQAGVDVAVIQRLMGHVSVETTARYFRPGQDEIDAAVLRTFGAA